MLALFPGRCGFGGGAKTRVGSIGARCPDTWDLHTLATLVNTHFIRPKNQRLKKTTVYFEESGDYVQPRGGPKLNPENNPP